jgi:hypothetical protein
VAKIRAKWILDFSRRTTMTQYKTGNRALHRYGRNAAAVVLGAGFLATTQCNDEPIVAVHPEDPMAIISSVGAAEPGDDEAYPTLADEDRFLDLGDSVVLSAHLSSIGANGGDGPLLYFWEIESKPFDSLLVDESLLNTDSGSGDDDSAGGEGDELDLGDAASHLEVTLSPDIEGLYGITLQVSDGERVSDLDQVVVQVGGSNLCPVSNSGEDVVAQTGTPAQLDGSGSVDDDIIGAVDDQVLEYLWHFSLVPGDSALSDADIYGQGTDEPYIIPDVAGTYIVQLLVNDGSCTSLPDYVTVQATNGNAPPVADAGTSVVLTPCAASQVTLDGTASYDPEGQQLDYRWSFTRVPTGSSVSDANLQNRFTATPRFNWDLPGIYTLQLNVNDGEVDSPPDYVAVSSVPPLPNNGPIAIASEDQVISATASCSTVNYNCSCTPCGSRSTTIEAFGSSDPEQDPLNYIWTVQTGPATISGAESIEAEVTLDPLGTSCNNTATEVIDLNLTVYDCRGADEDTVRITFLCNG